MDDFICPFSVDFDQNTYVQGTGYATSYGYPGSSSKDFKYCQDDVQGTDIASRDNGWIDSCTMGEYYEYPNMITMIKERGIHYNTLSFINNQYISTLLLTRWR